MAVLFGTNLVRNISTILILYLMPNLHLFGIRYYNMEKSLVIKDKRIILYAVPISLWPMQGKENRYFYTRQQ